LRSNEPTHILLSGPPGTAKTIFLLSLRQHLKDSFFVDGGATTKAGIIDYLFKNGATYLLIDEIDKMFFIHTVDILTNGLSMDMVAGSMILAERDGQGDPSLAVRGSTERNFRITLYIHPIFHS
jgi:DNA replicative helicase MCM subunit Mcm2 (Cdc46/Mcm family)